MSGLHKLIDFARCALRVGSDPVAQAAIFWHETRNLRVRLRLARHHPDRVYSVRTIGGPAVRNVLSAPMLVPEAFTATRR